MCLKNFFLTLLEKMLETSCVTLFNPISFPNVYEIINDERMIKFDTFFTSVSSRTIISHMNLKQSWI